jgi:hypothetical protein
MATRDTGYYLVHYTNLHIPNADEVKTGTSPAYWDGSMWNLFVDVSGFKTDDSNIDHVSPRLTPNPNGSSGGWFWIKPRPTDWRIAWTGNLRDWVVIRESLAEDAFMPLAEIEEIGAEVQQKMVG